MKGSTPARGASSSLFPEVRPHRDPEGGDAVVLPPPPPPETLNGAVTDAGNDPDLLTEDGQVRMTVQKAPRS